MRMLRYLLPIALVFALTGIAKADDFQMVVLDPIEPNPPTTFITYAITNASFTAIFTPCAIGQVPSGAQGTYWECFTGFNDLMDSHGNGITMTSLFMTFPTIPGQTSAACSPDGDTSLNLFSVCNPSTSPTGFTLDFSGGGIAPGVTFVIAEYGVLTDFPNASAVANAPEPSSFLLLSTGALMAGLFFAYQRRHTLCALRS
jgi:hypothetical protein